MCRFDKTSTLLFIFLTTITISSSHATDIPTEGLISYWKMEGDNGATMIDQMNVNHGYYYNAPSQSIGKQGHAMTFDGLDDYAIVLDNSTLDFGNQDFSVSFFFKKLAPSSVWDNCDAIGKWVRSGFNGENEWYFGTCSNGENNGVLFMTETDGGYIDIRYNTELPINTWHHVVGMRSGDKLKLYINGSFVGSSDIGNLTILNAGRHLVLAQSQDEGWPRNSNVAIDELSIYNRALTSSEVITLAEQEVDNSTFPPTPPTPVPECNNDNTLQAELDAATLQINQLETENKTLKTEVQEYSSTISEQQSQIEDLNSQATLLDAQIKNLAEENQRLHLQTENLQSLLSQQQQDLSALVKRAEEGLDIRLPGDTSINQLDNLISIILDMNKGRQNGIKKQLR